MCPRCRVVETLQFTAPWGFRGGATRQHFSYVIQGCCRLEATGIDAAVSLVAGDLAVLMPGREHCLRDSRNSSTVPPGELHGTAAETSAAFRSAKGDNTTVIDSLVLGINAIRMRRGVVPDEEGHTVRMIYGSVVFDERQIVPLLVSVPSVVVIPGANGKAMPWIDQTMWFMIQERDEGQFGSQSVVDYLSQVIFIQALRKCLSDLSSGCGNWLAALTDPDIGLALKVMHTSLDSPWTVAELARRVCLSRSVFASRFKDLLSTSPMQYLMERRMQRACELLAEDRYGIKQIALRVGYASKSAFSNAFKRWSGLSPQTYRRRLPKTPTDGTDRGPAV